MGDKINIQDILKKHNVPDLIKMKILDDLPTKTVEQIYQYWIENVFKPE